MHPNKGTEDLNLQSSLVLRDTDEVTINGRRFYAANEDRARSLIERIQRITGETNCTPAQAAWAIMWINGDTLPFIPYPEY